MTVGESLHWKRALLILFLCGGGVIYVGNAWSPSSYGLILPAFGVKDSSVVWGKPRPIRSDEYAVLTPFTQATVNNHFERYNRTSPYREDLRMVYSLPVFDWGMLFKPGFWLYPFLNPAYAFSFNYYLLTVLFIFGYTLLFRRLAGLAATESVLLALTLFFTAFTQFWWTVLGPALAFFPWLLVSMDLKWALPWRLLLFYWFAVCWLVSIFYPPLFISLAFAAGVLLLAFRPAYLRPRSLLSYGLATGLAIATVALYLQDYLINTWTTIYPGQRISRAGELDLATWIGQFVPTATSHHYETLIGINICEIGVVGSFFILMAICFLDYDRLRERRISELKTSLILGVGILAMNAWMLFPLPSALGLPLLWNRVPGRRMLFAEGLLLLLFAYLLLKEVGFKLTWGRTLLFAGAILLAWDHYKFPQHINLKASWLDFVILLPLGLIALAYKKRLLKAASVSVWLLVSALLVNVRAVGGFNPIQSAWPIFNRPETPVTQGLDWLPREKSPLDGRPMLVLGGFPGATLNGWGYPSVSHVLAVPQLDFFHAAFPHMGPREFNELFNRYSHIILTNDAEPKPWEGHGDAIAVPITAFIPSIRSAYAHYAGPLPAQEAGNIDGILPQGSDYIVRGWAPWRGVRADQRLYLIASKEIVIQSMSMDYRPDVAQVLNDPAYARSGFTVNFRMLHPMAGQATPLALCVIAVDLGQARASLLHNSDAASCGIQAAKNAGLQSSRAP